MYNIYFVLQTEVDKVRRQLFAGDMDDNVIVIHDTPDNSDNEDETFWEDAQGCWEMAPETPVPSPFSDWTSDEASTSPPLSPSLSPGAAGHDVPSTSSSATCVSSCIFDFGTDSGDEESIEQAMRDIPGELLTGAIIHEIDSLLKPDTPQCIIDFEENNISDVHMGDEELNNFMDALELKKYRLLKLYNENKLIYRA